LDEVEGVFGWGCCNEEPLEDVILGLLYGQTSRAQHHALTKATVAHAACETKAPFTRPLRPDPASWLGASVVARPRLSVIRELTWPSWSYKSISRHLLYQPGTCEIPENGRTSRSFRGYDAFEPPERIFYNAYDCRRLLIGDEKVSYIGWHLYSCRLSKVGR
jgi:hypothetical protein